MEISGISLGIDIATSLAVVASAVTFLRNQKKQNALRIDGTARATAAEQLQKSIHAMSNYFMDEIVTPYNQSQNRTKDNLVDMERLFYLKPELPSEWIEDYKWLSRSVDEFVDMAFSTRYQVYPLLDVLEAGGKSIKEYKAILDELLGVLNKTNRTGKDLLVELEGVLSFCEQNPSSFEELDEDKKKELFNLATSIMRDPDYDYWVNSFVPDELIERYWNDESEEGNLFKMKIILNFIDCAQKHPNRLRSQVFYTTHFSYQEIKTTCKKFLIMLAAINYTLLCPPGSKAAEESPLAVAKRYESDDYFALEREIR